MSKRTNNLFLFTGVFLLLLSFFAIFLGSPFWQAHYFPFAWVGYFFVIDALCYVARETSILSQLRIGTIALFIISVPFWLFFEVLNQHLHLWTNRASFGGALSQMLYGISHSSVVPAFLATLLLFCPNLKTLIPDRQLSLGLNKSLIFLGVLSFFLTLIMPHTFYPLVWCFLVFILDPINGSCGRLSVFHMVFSGKIKPLLSFFVSGFVIGLFWEGLNSLAPSAWSYHLPYGNHIHLFQMPLAGYLGYVAFGFNIFVFTVWFSSLFDRKLV